MERTEIVNQGNRQVGDSGKDLESRVAQTCFVIEDFGSNRTGMAIENAWHRKCMASP